MALAFFHMDTYYMWIVPIHHYYLLKALCNCLIISDIYLNQNNCHLDETQCSTFQCYLQKIYTIPSSLKNMLEF